jgi:hypothetical protein
LGALAEFLLTTNNEQLSGDTDLDLNTTKAVIQLLVQLLNDNPILGSGVLF